MVEHIVAVDGGYVAAGVSYEAQLPGVGPAPAHTLRIWLSADGRTWEPVAAGLENVQFTSLVVRADGVLLATGRRSTLSEFGHVESGEVAAWTSPDGRAWADEDIGMPSVPPTIVQGTQGFLAVARPDLATEDFQLWHSPDGITWTAVREGKAATMDLGAGEEGFVVIGRTAGDSAETFVIASGDGREWFDAPSAPPTIAPLVAPLGGDWIAMSAFGEAGTMASGETWSSANGLDWQPHGQAPMSEVGGDPTACQEFPRYLLSAGPWLVAPTDLAHPCSEGAFVVHGSQLISHDGTAWTALPFSSGTPGVTRSGAAVNAAVATEGELLLAGEQDGVATFWIGERP